MNYNKSDTDTRNILLSIRSSIKELRGKLLNRKLDENSIFEIERNIVELRNQTKQIRANYAALTSENVFNKADETLERAREYNNTLQSLIPISKRRK